MKKLVPISVILIMLSLELLHGQTTLIPDANFEQALIDLGIDSDSTINAEVLTDEINTVTNLNTFNYDIEDLTGIEDFDSLKILNCSNNRLTVIDLSNNLALVDLNCSSNLLSSLSVSANTSLENLSCQDNFLTALDISGNTLLKNLDFTKNQISNINTSTNDSLVSLKTSNNRIMNLDISRNLQLTELYCSDNRLTNLVTTANDSLTTFYCASNQLTSLDLSNNNSLIFLDCSDNQLASLNVSMNRTLEHLTCSSNQLLTLDVYQNDSLTLLACSNNLLKSLDVSQNIALENLICASNQLTALDIGANLTLRTLDFSFNLVKRANLSDNDSLRSLDCSNNQLQYLNIENGNNDELGNFNALNNPDLMCIAVDDSSQAATNDSWLKDATAFYSENCIPLQTYIPDNNFEQALIDIGLDFGALDSQVVTDSINSLQSLDLSGESIADLTGIHDFSSLTSLNCSNNLLANLDFTKNTALVILKCTDNDSLISLNIKNNNNANLDTLDARNNPMLSCIAIDNGALIRSGWSVNGGTVFSENCNSGQTFVPDDNFEQALINLGLDVGPPDNYIVTDSINTLKILEIDSLDIFDLTGIEDFVDLDTLNCSSNNLSELDVSQLVSLKKLSCFSNYLSTLDVTNNDSLISLNCGNNKLNILDVSQNSVLKELIFDSNYLTAIDIGINSVLTHLNCNSNLITSSGLNIANARELEQLYCANNQIISLNISQNSLLKKLDCRSNFMETLDLASNDSLQFLNCSLNLLAALDVSSNSRLDTVVCNSNQLESLTFVSNPLLRFVSCNDNLLTGINLSSNDSLGTLLISDNELTTLDVTRNGVLNILHCDGNRLDALDITNNPLLLELSCQNNQLSSLNTGQNIALVGINCDDNQLDVLDLSANVALVDLSCNNNQLDSLNINLNAVLERLACDGNQLNSLDITSNTDLSVLSIAGNQIDEINTNANIALTSLVCDENELTTLNLDNNPLLSNISCYGNEIVSLDLSIQTELQSLNCSNNQLTSIIVRNGNNTILETFNSTNNPDLTCIEIDDAASIGENWQKDEGATFSEDCHYRDTFVPDDNFESALAFITGVPDDNDDYIPTSSIDSLTTLNISNDSISDLTGIQDFASLQILDISYNIIDSLNLSENSTLVNLNISNNQVVEFELSEHALLEILDMSTNQIKSFNTDSLTSLIIFNSDSNLLAALDFSNNTLLTTLSCNSNELTSLRVKNGNNGSLTTFDATGNPDLTCIEIDDETMIGSSWQKDSTASYSENCHYNETYVPDDAFEQALIDLGYDYSSSAPLDDYVPTARINSVTTLSISNENIADLTGLQDFIALVNINCSFNQLTELDLGLNPNLENVNCSGNQLAALDISQNPALTDLNISSNQLTSLDIMQNVNLVNIRAQLNQLFSVDANNGNNQDILFFDLRNNPNLTCILVDDPAASQGYSNWFKDQAAAYKIECNDDDNDGILDADDQCPTTPFGDPVDLFGCSIFSVPVDNFIILTTGETCRSGNNGKVNIVADLSYNYTAALHGNDDTISHDFTNRVEIRNLRAATYELCLTIENEPDYKQCYTIVITEPEDLVVLPVDDMAGGRIAYELSGSSDYIIDFNGLIFETTDNYISLKLEEGKNTVVIKTPADCQGVFEETIYFSDHVILYPNPFNDYLHINLADPQDEEVQIYIYFTSGILVRSEDYQAPDGKLHIETSSLPSGIYMIYVNSEDDQSMFKIVKE